MNMALSSVTGTPARPSALGAAMITSIVEHGKNILAAAGVGSALLGAYAASGLPIPASQGFVEQKVATVVTKIDASDLATAKKIDALNASTLELQRKSIVQQKARLRFEAQANASLLPRADSVRRVTLERRSAEIRDELADLDRDDEALRMRIEKLKPAL